MSIGDFPESLSQAILVGIMILSEILVSKIIVRSHINTDCRDTMSLSFGLSVKMCDAYIQDFELDH